MNRHRIVIIGGGIGGAAAGIALRRRGFEVVVHEARTLRGTQYGGCYVLWYAGVLSLARLGLADVAAKLGHDVHRLEMCDKHGRVLNGFDAGIRGRPFGAVPLAIRRADLLNALYDELGDENLRLNSTFREYAEDARGVTAWFTDGTSDRGAVLVGADGLESTLRAHLHGLKQPHHPGYAHWSGVATSDGGARQGVFRILHGDGARFAYFHLGDGRVCWWCVRRAPQGADGDHFGEPDALAALVRNWEPTPAALLAATPAAGSWRRDTLDRSPLRTWGRGRVTLLGDAAHAMTFDLGQGAGTSLTDSVTLADHLAAGTAVIASLRGYEGARRAVTVPLALASRRIGAAAAWGGPFGPAVNATILRTIGVAITPQLMELDARSHSALTRGGQLPATAPH